MISRGVNVNSFTWIRLILEEKLGDDRWTKLQFFAIFRTEKQCLPYLANAASPALFTLAVGCCLTVGTVGLLVLLWLDVDASANVWPEPAVLNLASSFFFSKNFLIADILLKPTYCFKLIFTYKDIDDL